MNSCGILSVLSFIFINFASCVVLNTRQGALNGEILTSRGGRPFYAFYSIPYAEPPTGELRFKSPVPAKSWAGVRDATVLPPTCVQIHIGKISGQEDCLYLNVYTPKTTNQSSMPVMVYTYGGRFMYGNAHPDKFGPHYFMDKDVILITYHYRLGVFGFLSTEDEVLPGNYGLKDEVAVLQWIQNYIGDFGGDKNRVTLMGGSSGGTSASLALISPLAKGLFHRMISQSGHPMDMEKSGRPRLYAWKYASIFGCNDENIKTSEALLDCLKDIPAEKLASHNDDLFTLGNLLPVLPWGPVIENEKVPGAFLVDDPHKLLERGSDIPWIMGINSDDGGMMALFTYSSYSSALLQELDINYKTHFPLIFRYGYHVGNSTEKLDYVTEMYKCQYFGEKNISQDINGFANMFTSTIYLTGIQEAVKLYKGPKYVYYYDHKNNESFAHTYSDSDVEMGVIHGDELISMYNWSSVITPITKGVDFVVSEQIIDLWTNFAAKGDPNNEDEIIWKPVESSNIEYLHIKNGVLEMKNQFLKSEYEFLDSIPVDGYF